MPDPVRSAKRHLIAVWLLGVAAVLVTAPIALIAGVFATDSGTANAMAVGLLVMISPAILLILPIISTAAYTSRKLSLMRAFAYTSYALNILIIAGLAHVIFG